MPEVETGLVAQYPLECTFNKIPHRNSDNIAPVLGAGRETGFVCDFRHTNDRLADYRSERLLIEL